MGLTTRLPSISIDNWNAHLFTLQRRKCIAFVHKETFYSFVLFDVVKKDFKNLKQLFIDNFLDQLQADDLLTNDLKLLILKDFETFDISSTDGDRSTIGYLSDCIERISWEDIGEQTTLEQAKVYVKSKHYNDNLIGARNYVTAKMLMIEKLKNYT